MLWALALTLGCVAGVEDLRRNHIPNWINAGTLGAVAALLAAVIGALLAAASLAWNRHRRVIPYAPAIVLGAWLALLGKG
jgi:Flp pilus assembly protein protease CpaA